MSWSFWSICLLLANMTGFNRFCQMYCSTATYNKMFSVGNTKRILAFVFLYHITIFAFSQYPSFQLVFDHQMFYFKLLHGPSRNIFERIYMKYDTCYVMLHIVVTPIWYVLVYTKVKKEVQLLLIYVKYNEQ